MYKYVLGSIEKLHVNAISKCYMYTIWYNPDKFKFWNHIFRMCIQYAPNTSILSISMKYKTAICVLYGKIR